MAKQFHRVLTGLCITLSASVLVMSAASAQRRPPVSDSATIVSLEHEWLTSRDSATLDRILAPDFLHPVAQGVIINKADQIDWAMHHPVLATHRSRIDGLAVRLYGSTAIATGSVIVSDTAGHELARNLFTDVFLLRAGRWQAVNAQETPVK